MFVMDSHHYEIYIQSELLTIQFLPNYVLTM